MDSSADSSRISASSRLNSVKQVAYLEVRATPGSEIKETSLFPIYEGANTIGRSSGASISFSCRTISRKHARIDVKETLHTICPYRGVNKTKRNGVVLDEEVRYEITDGVQLTFADVECVYHIGALPTTENPVHNSRTEKDSKKADVSRVSGRSSTTSVMGVPAKNVLKNFMADDSDSDDEFLSPSRKTAEKDGRQEQSVEIISEKPSTSFNVSKTILADESQMNEILDNFAIPALPNDMITVIQETPNIFDDEIMARRRDKNYIDRHSPFAEIPFSSDEIQILHDDHEIVDKNLEKNQDFSPIDNEKQDGQIEDQEPKIDNSPIAKIDFVPENEPKILKFSSDNLLADYNTTDDAEDSDRDKPPSPPKRKRVAIDESANREKTLTPTEKSPAWMDDVQTTKHLVKRVTKKYDSKTKKERKKRSSSTKEKTPKMGKSRLTDLQDKCANWVLETGRTPTSGNKFFKVDPEDSNAERLKKMSQDPYAFSSPKSKSGDVSEATKTFLERKKRRTSSASRSPLKKKPETISPATRSAGRFTLLKKGVDTTDHRTSPKTPKNKRSDLEQGKEDVSGRLSTNDSVASRAIIDDSDSTDRTAGTASKTGPKNKSVRENKKVQTHGSPFRKKSSRLVHVTDSPKADKATMTPKIPENTMPSPSAYFRKSPRRKKGDAQVCFTQMTGTWKERFNGLQQAVRNLGGEIVDSGTVCTHLVSPKFARSVKFMCAIARGVPIVKPEWVEASVYANALVDTDEYLLKDDAEEEKFAFSLRDCLRKAREEPGLFESYTFFSTPSVQPKREEMKAIILAAGGDFIERLPMSVSDDKLLMISCDKDRETADFKKAQKLHIPIVSMEFVFTGLLQREIDVEKHALPNVNIDEIEENVASLRSQRKTRVLSEPTKSASTSSPKLRSQRSNKK